LDAPAQLEVISVGAIEAELRRINRQLEVADRPQWVDGEVIEDENNLQLELEPGHADANRHANR
jgi:hypothetical protein